MTISDGLSRALDTVAARERDVLQAYTPGAVPAMPDVASPEQDLKTRDPLSVTAPLDAYFVVSGEHGRLFTRDGGFAMREGLLVDSNGRAVLGFSSNDGTLAPLRAQPADAAHGFTDTACIDPDGSVWYQRRAIDPRSGVPVLQRAVLGRLALARFPAGTRLRHVDPAHAIASSVPPHMGRPQDGNFGTLQTLSKTGSSIDIDLGLQRLQEAYLSLDAMRVAHMAQAGTQKTAMDLLK